MLTLFSIHPVLELVFKEIESAQGEGSRLNAAGGRAFWSTCSFPVLIPCADNIWMSCLVTDWANVHMLNEQVTWPAPIHVCLVQFHILTARRSRGLVRGWHATKTAKGRGKSPVPSLRLVNAALIFLVLRLFFSR